MKYFSLNCNTVYEFASSSIMPKEYALRAKELGYSGIGFADSNIYSFPTFATEAIKNDLLPIFGLRINLLSKNNEIVSAVIYILNESGYLNVCKLLALKERTYDLKQLEKCSGGLALVIDTDGYQFLDKDYIESVKKTFKEWKRIFNDFFLGISIYSKEDEEKVNYLRKTAEENDIKLIAFPKIEYLTKNDAYRRNILNKMILKSNTQEIEKTGPLFLLSPKVLEKLYTEIELKNIEELVNKINFEFFTKRGNLIHFDNEDEKLKDIVYKGLKEKIGEITPVYENRIHYELDVIKKMNFSSYFLIVSDYINFAINNNIKFGPRGSAGGSLVAYSLNITRLDPIKYGLSFERFLNYKRKNMPDIDVDFEVARREEVVNYLKRTYPINHVCNIITFTTLGPRGAIDKICPIIGVPAAQIRNLKQCVSKRANNFEEALEDDFFGNRLKELLKDDYYKNIIDLLSTFIGIPINKGFHNAGVILSDNDITLTCPLNDGISSFEYEYMERLGYLKVDILHLDNLDFIKEIERRIVAKYNKLPDVINDLNNKEVYKNIRELNLSLIFQLESYGMKKAISEIKPDAFKDLAALIALYRPGPKDYISLYAKRKNENLNIKYPSEKVKDILDETYGIMIYQEQVMEIAKAIASFSLDDADLLRRAISKKKDMEIYHDKFISGALDNKISKETAEAIFSDIEKFAGFGFNKSHAYNYALMSYTLMYYKTFYPEEFYLAAIEKTGLNSTTFPSIGNELYKLGYFFVNPDINNSQLDEFKIIDKKIYVPLSGVNQSDNKLNKAILEEREKGKFIDIYDFVKRCNSFLDKISYKSITSLIDAGCFDSIFFGREELKKNFLDYVGFANIGYSKDEILIPDSFDEDYGSRLYLEKQAIGLILSTRLKNVVSKDNYKTFLVTDTSRKEFYNQVSITLESKEFTLRLNNKENVEKGDFILIPKSNISSKDIIDSVGMINAGKKRYKR